MSFWDHRLWGEAGQELDLSLIFRLRSAQLLPTVYVELVQWIRWTRQLHS